MSDPNSLSAKRRRTRRQNLTRKGDRLLKKLQKLNSEERNYLLTRIEKAFSVTKNSIL